LRVLVIDDERNIRTTLSVCLEGIDCRVTGAETGQAALAALEREPFDLVFLDLRLGSENGLELLPKLLSVRAGLRVVVITAYATVDTAVEAIKKGAVDYLPKPFTPAQIRHLVGQLSQEALLSSRMVGLEGKLAEEVPEAQLETDSPKMRAELDVIRRAAASDAPVLLRGESGTGKGVLARALHAESARRDAPFVSVNCPTLSEDLLASELFGHVVGAFTGAVRDQVGRVEAAAGGTLFLDEIGEIAPSIQSKLLRFVQEKAFERVGDQKTRRADVRIVTATNRDLETDIKAGRFREDLLFRLNVIEVTVPALRERPEDILRLARGFLAFFSRAGGRPPPELSEDARSALLSYAWPGNVRELRNTMERAMILFPSSVLTADAFGARIGGARPSGPEVGGDVSLEALEDAHIQRVVSRAETLEDAARILGIDVSTLRRKRKRHDSSP
jgi:NtrC-family two-component system response regulator AlgB